MILPFFFNFPHQKQLFWRPFHRYVALVIPYFLKNKFVSSKKGVISSLLAQNR